MYRACVRLALTLALSADVASAFCRTTTCNPEEMDCPVDSQGCMLEGTHLKWTRGCTSFVVQESGSTVRSLTADDLHAAVQTAAETWLGANCGDAVPYLEINTLGTVECDRAEFNSDGYNANIWMFRDEGWNHDDANDGAEMIDSNAVAFTTVTFNAETGAIVDADAEFNSENVAFVTEATAGAYDLTTVATHEMGHFLGLDHSREPGAVMNHAFPPGFPRHDLTADDEAGMCAIYESPRPLGSCEPQGGFSGQCKSEQPPWEAPSGCSLVHHSSRRQPPVGSLALLALIALVRRRRTSPGSTQTRTTLELNALDRRSAS